MHKLFSAVMSDLFQIQTTIFQFWGQVCLLCLVLRYKHFNRSQLETPPPHAARRSRFGSEPSSVEDDVDVWRHAILHARNVDEKLINLLNNNLF